MLRPGTFALTALLAALSAIGPLTTDMYLPSLPDIVRLLHTNTAQGQFTVSAYLIGFAVGQIVYGPLSDRHGRKPVLIGAIVFYGLASFACSAATSIEMLITARFAQALGGSGGIVLARAVVRDLYSGARAGRELSMISAVMALAPVLAPIVGGTLQTGFGWRSVFITLVVIAIIGVAAISLLLPETLAVRSRDPVSPATITSSYRLVARNPVYLVYTGLATTSYAGLFAWISGASFVLQNLYGLTPFTFGFAFAVGSVGYGAGASLSARLSRYLGIDGIIGIGGAAITVGSIGMLAAAAAGLGSALTLVVPMAVYLAGLGMVLPQSIAGAMTPFPDRAGTASSMLGFIQQSVAAMCGAIVGMLLGHSAWPLAVAVALAGCATLALWIAMRLMHLQTAKH